MEDFIGMGLHFLGCNVHFLQANPERGAAGSSAESDRGPVPRVSIPCCSGVWFSTDSGPLIHVEPNMAVRHEGA